MLALPARLESGNVFPPVYIFCNKPLHFLPIGASVVRAVCVLSVYFLGHPAESLTELLQRAPKGRLTRHKTLGATHCFFYSMKITRLQLDNLEFCENLRWVSSAPWRRWLRPADTLNAQGHTQTHTHTHRYTYHIHMHTIVRETK